MDGKKAIRTRGAPEAIGPYSQGIAAGGFVFLSGQIALDPDTGALVSGGIREQTTRVLRNLGAVLAAAGASFEDVVKTTVYLRDLSDFAVMNEIYAGFFPDAPPARATIQAARLPKDALVEIDAVAKLRA